MNKVQQIYKKLFEEYGPQGWWPLLGLRNTKPINHTKSGSIQGYHPGDYSFPSNDNQRFEICVGAILTQNTSWVSVEKALVNLSKSNALSLKGFNKLSDGKLKELIKPAGYFNQKALYLKEFARFFGGLGGRVPLRPELLAIKGIGPETADSILLYAFKVPSFVVDAYTKRVFSKLGLIEKDASYDSIKSLFEKALPKDFKVYQEYHALIVEHGKNVYK